jgi:F-type H+-transporting ATPase subunit alpha
MPRFTPLKKIKVHNNLLEEGRIVSLKDGVACVSGLFGVMAGERVYLTGTSCWSGMILGLVLSLEYKTVSVVVFGKDSLLSQGALVIRSKVVMDMPLSLRMFGRVIDALGNTLDGLQPIRTRYRRPVDTKAVGIIPRKSVHEPMQTGILVIDSITPVGCGQRELIIGDRQSGKTTIALDTILNQHY